MTIQLYVGARGKTRGGEIVEIEAAYRNIVNPAYVWRAVCGRAYTKTGRYWADGDLDDRDIIELLPPRQYVDTPFAVGKTYPTKRGKPITIKGFYLWGVDGEGYEDTYSLDGRYFLEDGEESQNDLLPTPIEDKPKQTVTLELTDEQLAKVREALK